MTKNDEKESASLRKTISILDTIISDLGDGSNRKRPLLSSETKKNISTMTEKEDEFYRFIYPCLVEQTTNVATFVIGARGSGKTTLIENCLSRLDRTKFTTLRLNGLVARGKDVAFCVHELARQLSELGLKMGQQDSELSELLRLKRTSFTSNLSLLNETFQLAKVDKKPILIILDELDAFAESPASLDKIMVERAADRQLLLYHILDRVTDPNSLLCFVGTTSHFSAVTLLEKRVRSRAEGTSRTIFVKPFDSYKSLLNVLLSKVTDKHLYSNLLQWLDVPNVNNDNKMRRENEQAQLLRLVIQRNYRIGKDLRWFIRVLSLAFSLYRNDIQDFLGAHNNIHQTQDSSSSTKSIHIFKPDYLLESLRAMGASWCTETNVVSSSEPRMQILKDLSSPQVALLLAARRILARDAIKEIPKPLTIHRILQEYQLYRGQANRFSQRLLLRTFSQLLDMDVFRPSSDHSGGGPLQYKGCMAARMDVITLSKLPLHLPYDLDSELTRALKNDILDCSTALKEWGKRKN